MFLPKKLSKQAPNLILTKLHNYDQITQFRPNITNLIWAMYVRLHIHLLWYNLGGIFSGGVVVYILKEKECKHFVFQPSSNELF